MTSDAPKSPERKPWLRRQVLDRFAKLRHGYLRVEDTHGAVTFGLVDSDLNGTIRVNDGRFYRRVALHGGLGLAESYVDGDWDTLDLTATLRVLAANLETLQGAERGVPTLLRPLRSSLNWLRRNTRLGSQRNIAAHYDLSNDFFTLMLDPTMTYSSGYFPQADSSLEEASREKYDRICRKLRLGPSDHVLEIGTGWGGFALHAAGEYGCRITTTTISKAQHDYAAARFNECQSCDRIELLLTDYRDLHGAFDKLVSIEMIEAVGVQFLPTYFRQCSRLLKPSGAMLLQAITIPDCRYDRYRQSVDFIQKHIFPGGFLPSPSGITDCLRRGTDFNLEQVEDFSDHYARTLAAWRGNLNAKLPQLRELGFDDCFLRLWWYYLAYCEAGFSERRIGVSQWLLTKPRWRHYRGSSGASVPA